MDSNIKKYIDFENLCFKKAIFNILLINFSFFILLYFILRIYL